MTKLKTLTDNNIAEACDLHGAKAISDAAYQRMNGDHAALPAVGLNDPQKMGDAHRITVIAHSLMSPDERAEDLTDATIALAKVGRPTEMAGGKRVNVYLDADSLARAATLGKGNVSEGIRIALSK